VTSPGARPDGPEVVEVTLVRVRVPLPRAVCSGHGTEDVRDVVLVRVEVAGGSVGWGECSALALPTYTSEYTAGAWAVLRDVLVPAALEGRVPDVVGHPMARTALAVAGLDAHLRAEGQALAARLGLLHGAPRAAVAVTAVVGRSDDPDEVVAEVARHVEAGAALVKLKVTPRPLDLEAVAAVRTTWPDLALAVDGNGTLDNRSLSLLDAHGLAYVEQPAPADALLESAGHARRIDAPVALDESVTSEAVLETIAALGAAAIVNVKPARAGGPHAAARLATRAVELGLVPFVGGMLETGVGRAAALAVASLPVFALPTDLGPSSRYADPAHELTEPLELDAEGRLPVPAGPGIGVVPRPDRVDAVAIDRLVLRG
jgi:O-succinylbenzoate synthase